MRTAVDDVLGQDVADLEVVIVDDGSSDGTSEELAAISDPRVRTLSRPNEGRCRARNAGAAIARGAWLVFLDDDDRVDADWLSVFRQHIGPSVGLVSCGATLLDDHGVVRGVRQPEHLGPLYGDVKALFGAGAFAVAKHVFEAVGGYDALVPHGENYELGIRIGVRCRAESLRVEVDDRCPVRWVRRREQRSADRVRNLYGGATRLLDKHRVALGGDRNARWTTLSIAGVNAARLGHTRNAQRLLLRAAFVRPTRSRSWLRLGAACLPVVARRVWGDYRG
jgi:glycosyltransferase involved in cell wall biosynthesis